jgi:lysophospholipase L1-like esterase
MMRYLLVGLVVLGVLAAAAYVFDRREAQENPVPEGDLVMLGDSIAAGVGASDPEQALLPWLDQSLRGRTHHNFAFGGAKVSDVLNQQVSQAEQVGPGKVYVIVGANDVTGFTSASAFRDQYRRMLQRLQETGARLVVANIPALAETPVVPGELKPLARERTAELNKIIAEEAAAVGAELFDFHSLSQRHLVGKDEVLAEDRYHPNEEGYALIVQGLRDL